MRTVKLLCVVILGGIVGGSAWTLPPAGQVAGTNILDFDTIANIGDNIPAMFQPKIYEPAGYNAAGPNNLRYVYFTVFNPGDVEDGNFCHAVVRNPVQTDNNIYFPADGSQPTTPEAVAYSCANVDNRENSPITEWYMKMFGVIPFQNTGNPANDYIKAGWDNASQNAQRIISFDVSVDGTMVNDPNIPVSQISRRALFEREFRKIASTSVGRVLLYRILIEIRRHSENNIGRFEYTNRENEMFINERNIVRSVVIKYKDNIAFYKAYRLISFVAQKTPASIIKINNSVYNMKYPTCCAVNNIVYESRTRCGLGNFKCGPSNEQSVQYSFGKKRNNSECTLLTID